MEIGELVKEMVGGVVAALLAWEFGFAHQGEMAQLFFIALVGGIAGGVVGFLIRLLFITPYKMHKELEQKIEELDQKLKTQELLVIHSAIWGVEGKT